MRISLCNEVVRGSSSRPSARSPGASATTASSSRRSRSATSRTGSSAVRRAQLRRIAEDHGLAITGLHWLLLTPDGLSITSRDEGTRARTLDVMRRLIELCADLGGSVLVHGSPKQRRDRARRHAARWRSRRAMDCFAAIAADAEQAGVTYCIEPLAPTETPLINTVEEAAADRRADRLAGACAR